MEKESFEPGGQFVELPSGERITDLCVIEDRVLATTASDRAYLIDKVREAFYVGDPILLGKK